MGQRVFAPVVRAAMIVLTIVLATACHRGSRAGRLPGGRGVDVQFVPNSARREGTVTDRALRFYAGDRVLLQQTGATFVGEFEVDTKAQIAWFGRKSNVDALSARVAYEAARVGATHFVLLESGVDVRDIVVSPEHTETQSESHVHRGHVHTDSVTVHRPAQSIRTESPFAKFAVFRIDPSRWAELPDGLRPSPLAIAPVTPVPSSTAFPAPKPVPTESAGSAGGEDVRL